MSEHYWADGTLKGELETLLYGPVGGLLQKWQNKAIRKAMKQVDTVSELKHRFEEAERLIQHQEHSTHRLADEVVEARHDRDYWKGLAQSREELNEGLGNRVEQLESDLAATRKQLAEAQALNLKNREIRNRVKTVLAQVIDDAEEYDFADGLGVGIPQDTFDAASNLHEDLVVEQSWDRFQDAMDGCTTSTLSAKEAL